MSSTLIIYSSTDGHTKTICERITNFSNDKNMVKIISLNEAPKLEISKFDKIVIGASIRYGKHSKELYKFINLNKNILDKKDSSFFSVNVVARKSEKNTPETNPYIKKFLKISNWSPKKIGVFAGKVDYPKYSFFDKYIIKLIMFITKGPTDTSQSYEFTDWSKVDIFAKKLWQNP
jgi:menaquinone-dependent protoporphyrinogen oxidase